MADEDTTDAAFLEELAGFLSEFGGSLPPSGHMVVGDAPLLIADTEELSSDSAAPSPVGVRPATQGDTAPTRKPSVAMNPVVMERRRAKQNALAAKRRVKYRQRLKEEWKSLRQQDIALSMKLRKLQSAEEEAKTCRKRDSLLTAWKAIAMRQMASRDQAEAEQRQLKASVAYRAELIENMSSLLQRRLLDEAHGETSNMVVSRGHESHMQSNDTVLFESLLGELDTLYEQTDGVIRSCGASIKPWDSMSYQPARKWHNGTEYFENVDSILVPLDYQRTCRAVWQAFIATEGSEAYHYEGVKDQENTVAVKMRCQYQWDTFGVASMTSHFVIRKYKEVDRLVFVWRALSEGEGAFIDMHLDDSGWGVLYPIAKGASNPMAAGSNVSVDSTILRHVARSVPVFFGEKSGSDTKTDQFVDLVVRSGVEDVEEMVRSIGKLLLDDVVASVPP